MAIVEAREYCFEFTWVILISLLLKNPDDMIKLSICIPTYNRALLLEKTISNLVNQITKIDTQVEIIISDNASTDNTREISKYYEKNYCFVKYFKNESNIGFDRNVDKSIKWAHGDYVWIVSDDDYYEDCVIAKIINVVNEVSCLSYLFLNYGIFHNDYRDLITLSRSMSKHNLITNNKDDFYLNTCFANTLVSSNVFKRSEWLRTDTSKYYNSGWIHVYVARDTLMSDAKAYVFKDILIRQAWDEPITQRKKARLRIGEENHDAYMMYHLKFADFAMTMVDYGYSMSVRSMGLNIAKHNNLRQIVFYKLSQKKYSLVESIEYYELMTKYFKNYLTFWLVDIFVLALPPLCVRIMVKLFSPIYLVCRSIMNGTKNEAHF